MKLRVLVLLVFSACLHTGAFAGELPDYVRYAENKRSARLEVAIRKFTLPSGQTVDLIGVVHIADAAYYQQLNQRFDSYDAVLFELVGDPRALTQAPRVQAQLQQDSAVGFIQQSASRHLDLAFQLGAIDYTKKNMVHADASAEEFARMQSERGENVLTLFVSAMQAQMRNQMSSANRGAMRELDTFALIRILMSQDSAAEFKKALAKNFDQMESMTAAMEGGPQGSAVLSGRNGVVLKKLQEVLAHRKQRRIAVFYGGAHMPGIEASLLKDMNAKISGEEWLAAWTMPKANSTKQPADTTPAP
jgi:hypothetical protein